MAHVTQYKIKTPNAYNSNSFSVDYGDVSYFVDYPTQPSFESSSDFYKSWTSNINVVLASLSPNVTVKSYDTDGSLYSTVTLDSTYTASNGQTIYYKSTTNVRATSGTNVISNVSLNNTLELMVFGEKLLVDNSDDPYIQYGQGDLQGDVISVPGLPTLSAVDTGLVTLYAPTVNEMKILADYLWTSVTQGTDQLGVLKEIAQAICRLIADPMKVIMGLSILPSRGIGKTTNRYQFSNDFIGASQVYMKKLTSQYYQVDCGSLTFNTLCGGTFLDYSPYSKFQVYLPFVGVVHVDANDFVGHTIGVIYNVDALSGSCTAFITKDNSVMYTYSGNVALNVPLSSESWAETWSAAMGLISSAVSGGVAGNTIGAAAKGIGKAFKQTAADIASNPSMLSPQVNHSGAIGGSSGFMNNMTPYVIREAVSFRSTAGMNQLKGYPLHKATQIGLCKGFTQVTDVHMTSTKALKTEIDEIESLLAEGVIV